MTILENRPNRALIVIDMQVGIVQDAWEISSVTSTVQGVVTSAREADVPVIWVQDHDDGREIDSDPWQLVDGLDPVDGEPRVDKAYGDAFAETDLEDLLADRGVGELVLVGAASEQCVRCTMHSAVVRGYDVALVQGAHTTSDLTSYGMPAPQVIVEFIDLIAAFGMQWPGRAGRSVAPAELAF